MCVLVCVYVGCTACRDAEKIVQPCAASLVGIDPLISCRNLTACGSCCCDASELTNSVSGLSNSSSRTVLPFQGKMEKVQKTGEHAFEVN